MTVEQDPEPPSIRVRDRRRFSADGEPITPAPDDEDAGKNETPAPAEEPAAQTPAGKGTANEGATVETPPGEQPGAEEPAAEQPRPPPPGAMPAASFEMLIVSLAVQANMELRSEQSPEGHVPDLELARHTIDMLDVLAEKTKGNLSMEENRLLQNTLTELRFRYVQCIEDLNAKAKK